MRTVQHGILNKYQRNWRPLPILIPCDLRGLLMTRIGDLGEITLRVGKEAITFYLGPTLRYTMITTIVGQQIDPIVSTASPTLTPFGDSDFLLFEEADSFLALEDDPTSSEVDPTYQDPEGDILLLEAILNSEPPPPPKSRTISALKVRKELKLL
ncbi:hypothetical protein Tco_0860493 [Tanacetum coccineum]|uniref:Reverse transcriptase domain-containing protein n=1 Tax=Tanacetum coccineum TaxID=301880 RepID=A0ABQ5BFN0_9ASTR